MIVSEADAVVLCRRGHGGLFFQAVSRGEGWGSDGQADDAYVPYQIHEGRESLDREVLTILDRTRQANLVRISKFDQILTYMANFGRQGQWLLGRYWPTHGTCNSIKDLP